MKTIKKILTYLCIFLMCIMLGRVEHVKADETASISISSASGNVGDIITITVTISASDGIDGATIPVSYDNSIIRPTSGGNSGVVTFSLLDMTYSSSGQVSMDFEIIGAGTTTLSVTGDARISVNGYRAEVQGKSSGRVTGSAPSSASSDNTLKSLQISPGTLSPAFSAGTTTYTATVGKDVDELVVSAAANDDKAKVSVSGRRMDPGRNTTRITVTAENGETRTYIIYTTKETDGQEAATKEAESSSEEVTEETSGVAESEVTYNNKKYVIASSLSDKQIPADYEETEIDYNGTKVKAAKGIKTQLILVYLENTDGQGGSGLYIYDADGRSFSPYNTVTEPEILYTILPAGLAKNKPEGYTLTKFTMNGQEVEVLMDNERQYCLFYGVSSLGEKGWFRYRVSDGTIQAYSVSVVTADSMADEDGNKSVNIFTDNKVLIIAAAIALAVVLALIIVIIVLSSKLSKLKKAFSMASKDGVQLDEYLEQEIDDYDLDDYEDDEDDITATDEESEEHKDSITVTDEESEEYKDSISATDEREDGTSVTDEKSDNEEPFKAQDMEDTEDALEELELVDLDDEEK